VNEHRVTDFADRVSTLLGSIGRLGSTLSGMIGARTASWASTFRLELRRVASTLALALVAAVFVIAAASFVAVAVLVAMWDTHPVLGASLVAGGFALLTIIAVLLLRNATRPSAPRR
jgi:hypothetical protein